jgi:Ca2+-binding RTX toxin-like protein
MRALLAAAVLLLALPAAASAGEISYGYLESGPYLDYVASPGELNRVTVTSAPGGFTLRDAGAPIVNVPSVCKAADEHTVTCELDDGPGVYLGDRDDTARASLELGVGLVGDDGDDVLTVIGHTTSGLYGGRGDDVLTGGDAFDLVEGDGGRDRLYGGGGDDWLNGDGPRTRSASDVIDGGSGRDRVNYSGHHRPVTIDLNRTTGFGEAAEDDRVRHVEDALGGKAGDLIRGDDGPNRLHGSGGSDTIRAGGGNDVVWINTPRAPRGYPDLDCGLGIDVVADMSSQLLMPRSCERARAQRFVVDTRLRRESGSRIAVRVKQRKPPYRRARHCRAVVELGGPYPKDATERPPSMGSASARAPVGEEVELRVRLNDYGRSLLASRGRTRVLLSVGGDDACAGEPAHRPPRAFTTLL